MRKEFPNHHDFNDYKCRCGEQLVHSNVYDNQCFCPICYTHYIKKEVIEISAILKSYNTEELK